MSDEMHPQQAELVRLVQVEIERALSVLGPKMDARSEPQFRDPEYRMIQAVQNTLRCCLEASLERMLPYSEKVPVELAVRLASYSLSALPMENQEQAVALLLRVFADAHLRRMASGVRLSTEWDIVGKGAVPNFPEGS